MLGASARHQIESQIRIALNYQLRLYLWEQSHDTITCSLGKCTAVQKSDGQYYAHLTTYGFMPLKMDLVSTWLRRIGATVVRVESEDQAVVGKSLGFSPDCTSNGRQWRVILTTRKGE
jgi:hypothetical protein